MTVSIRTTNRLTFCMPAGHGAVEFVELPSHLVDPAFLIAQKGPSLSQTDYQNVSAKLLQAHVPPSSRIFVSSPVQGDGKTCTAFNLACTMAKSGASVLLVELNFTEPRIRTALGNLKSGTVWRAPFKAGSGLRIPSFASFPPVFTSPP